MDKMKKYVWVLAMVFILFGCSEKKVEDTTMSQLKISENGRYFMEDNGKPFFWLGDTGWLLFSKTSREEAEAYLEDRKQKGFNVIQVMVIHTLEAKNVYGDVALMDKNLANPIVTEGVSFEDTLQYDFWDHVDFVIEKAEEKGLYMALVPVWGTNVQQDSVSVQQAKDYAEWLASRYKDHPNIIWLNGGDTYGNESTDVWQAIGNAIHETDTNHLQTFHPRGRMMSSDWFHNEPWLDFNMVQSGHRRYDQDDTERAFGQDNWRYMEIDYGMTPVKPTIDAEPSYEGIPQGLHDSTEVYWNDDDVRRYGYWSVFAGAFGYTYGHNAVMQFYQSSDEEPAFGAKMYWQEAIKAPGAQQMQYIKKLMLSRSYFDRVPDQSLIAGNNGEKYDRLLATRTNHYAFIYTYKGGSIAVKTSSFNASELKASWFNPRNGELSEIGNFENTGLLEFEAPGEVKDGNDWVLILDEI